MIELFFDQILIVGSSLTINDLQVESYLLLIRVSGPSNIKVKYLINQYYKKILFKDKMAEQVSYLFSNFQGILRID
jgi:hypothetical protein